MATYQAGGNNGNVDHSFVSYYEAHKPDISNELVKQYGNQYLHGLMEIMGAKKESGSIEYSHFAQKRIYRKIKATTLGGLSTANVTFTTDAASQLSIPLSASPYGGTSTDDVHNARVGDILLIKPASGVVSWGNYVHVIVTSVDDAAGTFTARSMSSAAIPAIATAVELAIVGNAHGEGSGQPASVRWTTEKITNNMQIIKENHTVTGTENLQKEWYEETMPSGMKVSRYFIKGEGETYVNFMNACELSMLTGIQINNNNLSDAYAANPLATTNGLLTEIDSRGVDRNYTALNGLTIADMEDHVIEQDKEKAGTDHFMFNGIQLDIQFDRELRDTFNNGGVTYGNFNFDQDKMVALNFKSFQISSYKYHKRTMHPFNDLQTLGADGYGFPYEGFTIPTKKAKIAGGEEMNAMVPTLRVRYLAKNGKDSSMQVTPFDGFRQSDAGTDTQEIRYKAQKGFELYAGNTTSYIKRA